MSDPSDTPADIASTLRCVLEGVTPRDARLLLAVSGGSDSMALLAAGHAAFGSSGRLVVAHVRHGLRPDDGQDAALVADVCANLGLACRVVHAAPPTGRRSETDARRRRMAALARLAAEQDARWVLLGHHLDDDLHTTVLHLLRGHRGDRALAGIPMMRALDTRTHLLRPFLAGPAPPDRRALAAWRIRAGLPCNEDPMNHAPTVLRNRVRAALESGDESLRGRLRAAQRAARTRLAARLLSAASCLEVGLRSEGLGSAIALSHLADDCDGDRPQALAERLRLLAACLAAPRRLDTRAAVLAELTRRFTNGGGWLQLPASPRPLRVHVTRGALQLPHEPLAAGSAASRVLAALSASSLYL